MTNLTSGAISLIASAAIYGSFGVLIQYMNRELPVISQIIFRYSLAVILVMLIFYITKPKLKVPKKAWMVLIFFAIVTQISIWSFTKGAVLTSIPSLLGSFYIGSIVTATILGITVFQEKIMIKNWIGTFIAIIGLYALTKAKVESLGIVFGLIAGSLECVTQAMRKYLKGVSRGVILLISLLGVLLVSLISAGVSGQRIYLPQMATTWTMGIVFAILVGIVNMTVTYGFRLVPMNMGSVIMSGEIVFGALFSVLFLSVSPTVAEFIASSAVILSILIQNIRIKEDNRIVIELRKMLEG